MPSAVRNTQLDLGVSWPGLVFHPCPSAEDTAHLHIFSSLEFNPFTKEDKLLAAPTSLQVLSTPVVAVPYHLHAR